MEGDLAQCNLKKLTEIVCEFKEGAVWSDGSKLTIEDVLSTYSLLAETDKNKRLQSGLSKFAITREKNTVTFRVSIATRENLEYLTLPILKKSVVESLRRGEKSNETVFSGEYSVDRRDVNANKRYEALYMVK